MTYPRMALLALPYSRLELPGWGTVLQRLGVFTDERWRNAPRRTIRGKWHGYSMDLNLANWSERQTYFLGRFYELPTQLLVKAAVHSGENFIDIGANIGMITLLASRCVGPSGKVHSFEPNPIVVERVRQCLDRNHISNVTLHPCGLSDAESELTLSVLTDNTGMGTFADVPPEQKAHVTREYRVAVRVGDAALPSEISGVTFVKIDVEGFECRVLRGLANFLDRLKPGVTLEAMPWHLERAGSTMQDLFDTMKAHGYLPYELDVARRRLRYRLHLRPLGRPSDLKENNMVWLHPQSAHAKRLAEYIDAR